MNSDSFLAHLSPDGREQTVAAHLAQTGELCAGFAGKFGEEARGRFIGAVHDMLPRRSPRGERGSKRIQQHRPEP